MPNSYLQEKFESIPGNETNSPTASTKILYPPLIEYTYDPGTNHMERDDEISRASNEPQSVLTERYAPTWSMSGRMYPDTIGWRLKHILGPPTTTAGDGIITDPDSGLIPVGAFRHVWDSTNANWGNSGASPMTCQHTAAFKDQSEFVKLKGCACESLTINTPETGGARFAANGPALYADDALADPSLTPAPESLATRPFTRSGLTLPTFLTSSGTHEDFGISISAPVEPVSSMGIASKWPDVMEKGEGLIVVTGSVAQRQLDADDIAALRGATGFAMKAKWLNDTIITGSTKHALWLEGINAQYVSGGPSNLANVRRIGSEFGFKLTTAGTGVAAKFTLVNGVSSYA
jgi:hypothetical protein